MMRKNWSVFRRRLKTPLCDYIQLRAIAYLIFVATLTICLSMKLLSMNINILTVLDSNAPSQADVVTFKAFSAAPDAAKFPHVARWYKHIASYESEFSTLPGDSSKAFTAYGPESTELPSNPKDKPEDDEDEDLFGSDSEEEDAAVVAERNKRLEDYKAKKAAKGPKPAAKSLVTLEVKPWGMCPLRDIRPLTRALYANMLL